MHLKKVEKRILLQEIIGFGLVIGLIWVNELFDIPHNVFGAEQTPVNWVESLTESVIIIIFAIITLSATSRVLKRIKYLEGFLPVCAFCKKIRVDDEWIPIEVYISKHSEAVFSHGFCPSCMEKNYGIKS